MHDEFLHRLRKEPPQEFAVRLRAHLRRQPMSPPQSKAPSRARTILTLLLLGGAAFAVTYFVTTGLPQPVIELYRQATARIGAERATTPGHRVSSQETPEGLPGDTRGESPPLSAPLRGGPIYSPATPTNTAPSPASAGGVAATTAAPVGGALAGSRSPDIRIVASWAAYPYAVAIAEHFNDVTAAGGTPFPHIEVSVRDSDRWPGPMCNGDGRGPDVAYAFEPVGTVSARPCPGVVAIPVGYEAVVLGRSRLARELNLTQRDVFLALAKWIPESDLRPGAVHENTNRTWRDIDRGLPPDPIEIMGPPLSSAAGRSMIELLMERGCNTYFRIAMLKTTDPAQYAQICRTVRTDGIYAEVSGLSPMNLQAEPNAVGIFGLIGHSSLGALSISKLDGVRFTLGNIEQGSYPGSSGLYLYVNRQRVPNPGLLGARLLFITSYLDSAYVPPPWSQYERALNEAQAP